MDENSAGTRLPQGAATPLSSEHLMSRGNSLEEAVARLSRHLLGETSDSDHVEMSETALETVASHFRNVLAVPASTPASSPLQASVHDPSLAQAPSRATSQPFATGDAGSSVILPHDNPELQSVIDFAALLKNAEEKRREERRLAHNREERERRARRKADAAAVAKDRELSKERSLRYVKSIMGTEKYKRRQEHNIEHRRQQQKAIGESLWAQQQQLERDGILTRTGSQKEGLSVQQHRASDAAAAASSSRASRPSTKGASTSLQALTSLPSKKQKVQASTSPSNANASARVSTGPSDRPASSPLSSSNSIGTMIATSKDSRDQRPQDGHLAGFQPPPDSPPIPFDDLA